MLVVCVIFFLLKQKTAYELRISDWSSDVCSSDLLAQDLFQLFQHALRIGLQAGEIVAAGRRRRGRHGGGGSVIRAGGRRFSRRSRSEARRDGKECVSPCRSRWSPSH